MDQNDSTVSKGDIAITVDVNMPEDSAIQEIRSPSHPIAVAFDRTSTSESQPPHLSRASATLSLGTSTLDKDIVLEIMHQVRYIGVNPSYSRPLSGSSGIFWEREKGSWFSDLSDESTLCSAIGLFSSLCSLDLS